MGKDFRRSIAVMGWGVWDGQGKTPTGGSSVTYELTKRLSEHFDCTMVFETSDKGKVGKTFETDDGFKKRFVPRLRVGEGLGENLLKDYDLIHFWDRAPLFTYRAYTKRLVPHCYTLHSAVSIVEWTPVASAFYIPRYDRITLGSHCLAEVLEKLWKIAVDVIPYGVDTEFFKPMDKNCCREQLNIPRGSFILGYLGRPAKLDFIFAYNTLRKIRKATGKKNLLLLVAGGNLKAKPTYITDDLLYLGYLDRTNVPIMLNSCDVFFNPVAGVQEGFGLTIVEAMACGLPIVTTSWNGYRETVSGDYGFLARTCWKEGDVWINQNDMVNACMYLVEDEGMRAECGREARRTAEQKYMWKCCVEKYRNLFLDTIQENPPIEHPHMEAPRNIGVQFGGKSHEVSLKETLKRSKTFRLDFQEIYGGFVSDKKAKEGGWQRFICKDNILNLPKYQLCMKKALIGEEERLRARFPNL